MKPLRIVYGLIGFVVVAALWQIIAISPISGGALPTATATFSEFGTLVPDGRFWVDTWRTIEVALGGFILAVVVGVVVGVLLASSQVTMHATRVLLEFLKPIPPIVILPLAVLVLGPTTNMGVFLVFYGCVLPIIMQTAAGVFDVDPIAVATAESFNMGRLEVLWRVVLPSSLSYIGTAIRVSVPTSLIIAVVAGLLGGGPGLGNSLLRAQLSGSLSLLFAYVVALGLLGLVFQGASELIERRMLHWHPSYRKEEH
ncbi:MAG: ABC transporter permease subunit [Terrimesophilobacter sp.]